MTDEPPDLEPVLWLIGAQQFMESFERQMYFDRAGTPLTLMQWAVLRENADVDYIRVAHTLFAEAVEVSTVWLGLNHDFARTGVPLIFETMIFGHTLLAEHQWRYATEEQARAGHAEVVALVKMELEFTT